MSMKLARGIDDTSVQNAFNYAASQEHGSPANIRLAGVGH
jgi:hypothetical protein